MATPTTRTHAVRARWEPRITTTADRYCTAFTLPSDGVLSLGDTLVTLTTDVLFQPQCTGAPIQELSSVANNVEPFYASVIPQVYVVAAATVIAWILVIMLIITPRTNLGNVVSPAVGRGRGIIAGASGGSTNLSGVGSRPWLQKVAALTVAIALTIATADTFSVAHVQYDTGVFDAEELREQVLNSLEILITRAISDVFVWLAQVQTLIRLFPRHKEKVLIKWIGFALIVFDTVFSCLNSFVNRSRNSARPRDFEDAIPALSYLFELALGLLYAAWVIYYALIKRRYAFYRSKMRSICVIALLSLISILTPVVFFVTDVSNPDVAGWGDYFRWVGAAAASVVVWEWVERIEALERDEKKDGILGREIFDGDEMLDMSPSQEMVWRPSGRNRYRGSSSVGGASDEGQMKPSGGPGGRLTQRFRAKQQQLIQHFPLGRAHSATTRSTPEPSQSLNGHLNGNSNGRIAFGDLPKPSGGTHGILGGITPPPQIASPINRAETSSAGSTVYVVRYDAVADLPQPPARPHVDANGNGMQARAKIAAQKVNKLSDEVELEEDDDDRPHRNRSHALWQAVPNPFKRKRASPPAEVQQAREAAAAATGRSITPAQRSVRFGFRHREATSDRKLTQTDRAVVSSARELPTIVIPAQRRGGNPQNVGVDTNATAPQILNSVAAAVNGHLDVSNVSASTTLTTNSHLNGSSSDMPSRPGVAGRSSQAHTALASTAAPSKPILARVASTPPRADDISPAAGGTAVIPAPRRSPLRRQDVSSVGGGNGGPSTRASASISASDHRSSPRHGS